MISSISQDARLFNLAEANELLPLLSKLTAKHVAELLPLQQRLDRILSNDPRRPTFEAAYEQQVSQWRGKVERLGVIAAGLWCVEFDVGEGRILWRYPELHLAHFRLNSANPNTVSRLERYIEECDPDWALR